MSDVEAKLEKFAALLVRWNSRINLVSRGDLALVRERHIADCLQLIPLLPPGVDRAIDLGSGGGFPGLVLAIATGIRFELIEADRRKAAFLAEAAYRIDVPVGVHAIRIEAAQGRLSPAGLVTARALAPMLRLLPLAAPLLAPDGTCLLLKGQTAAEELVAARQQWQMAVDVLPNRVHQGGVIIRIGHLRRAISGSP